MVNKYCMVRGCHSKQGDMKFVSVPVTRDYEFRERWRVAIGTENLPLCGAICIKHFPEEAIFEVASGKRAGQKRVRKGTIPSLHVPFPEEPIIYQTVYQKNADGEWVKQGGSQNLREVATADDESTKNADADKTGETDGHREETDAEMSEAVADEDDGNQVVFLQEEPETDKKADDDTAGSSRQERPPIPVELLKKSGQLRGKKLKKLAKRTPEQIEHDKLKKRIAYLEEENALLRKRNDKLGQQYRSYQRKNSTLNKKVRESKKKEVTKAEVSEMIKERLSRWFTPAQIRVMQGDKWSRMSGITVDDYSRAMALRLVSERAYRFMRKNQYLPLPGETTLNKASKTYTVPQGIHAQVLHLLKNSDVGGGVPLDGDDAPAPDPVAEVEMPLQPTAPTATTTSTMHVEDEEEDKEQILVQTEAELIQAAEFQHQQQQLILQQQQLIHQQQQQLGLIEGQQVEIEEDPVGGEHVIHVQEITTAAAAAATAAVAGEDEDGVQVGQVIAGDVDAAAAAADQEQQHHLQPQQIIIDPQQIIIDPTQTYTIQEIHTTEEGGGGGGLHGHHGGGQEIPVQQIHIQEIHSTDDMHFETVAYIKAEDIASGASTTTVTTAVEEEEEEDQKQE